MINYTANMISPNLAKYTNLQALSTRRAGAEETT
jgi:hypothetical protein